MCRVTPDLVRKISELAVERGAEGGFEPRVREYALPTGEHPGQARRSQQCLNRLVSYHSRGHFRRVNREYTLASYLSSLSGFTPYD